MTSPQSSDHVTNQTTDAFVTARPQLFAIAYRMLGSVSDAEDILQDVFERWLGVEQDSVKTPTGYLVRITTRACLDELKSARRRRETYPGEWLPEPIWMEDPVGADHSVSVALLCAMERLSPLERAAFLLHDVFDADYEEIATALNRSPEACRQLASRGRKHIQSNRPRFAAPDAEAQALTEAFFVASKSGDTEALTKLLAQEAVLISDGGGKAAAAINPILGQDRVIRLCTGLARKANYTIPHTWRYGVLNGQPGILSLERDGILQATLLTVQDGQITRIDVVRNPEKTRHLECHLPV